MDNTEAGRHLGVRYLLNGSVRKAGTRVRINARLIDSESGKHLWVERYDRQLDDIFDLQDEVTAKIIASLAVTLKDHEKERLAHRYTGNIRAYDYFLQGQAYLNTSNFDLAQTMYRKAITLDPGFARAYGAMSVTFSQNIANGWSSNPQEDIAQAIELAEKAVKMDTGLPQIYWALSLAYLFNHEHEKSLNTINQAIVVAPNYADGYGLMAWIQIFLNQADDAILSAGKALRLNPLANANTLYTLGLAYYWAARYSDAVEVLHTALERNPENQSIRIILAAAYISLNDQENAAWEAEEILNMNAGFSLTRWGETQPYRDPGQLDRLLQDLRLAGLRD